MAAFLAYYYRDFHALNPLSGKKMDDGISSRAAQILSHANPGPWHLVGSRTSELGDNLNDLRNTRGSNRMTAGKKAAARIDWNLSPMLRQLLLDGMPA